MWRNSFEFISNHRLSVTFIYEITKVEIKYKSSFFDLILIPRINTALVRKWNKIPQTKKEKKIKIDAIE